MNTDSVPSDPSAGEDDTVHSTQLNESQVNLLQEKLGYVFKDKSLLHRALTHRSALGKSPQNRPTETNTTLTKKTRSKDYERLEFLGDAVLDLTVAHLLIEKHPEAKEGELSKMRAALVNTSSLAEIANELHIKDFIILSRGERANQGNERPSILADVFESLIGAIYRDANFETAFQVSTKLFGDRIVTVVPTDPKTELQEALHLVGAAAPEYLLECVEGPEHAPTFVSVVKIGNDIAGRGRGTTKKASQQEAAAEALTKIEVPDPDSDLVDDILPDDNERSINGEK